MHTLTRASRFRRLWLANRGLWRVVRHAPQHHGAAGRPRVRTPAAYLGRPGADGPRVSALCRSTSGRAEINAARPADRSAAAARRHGRRLAFARVPGSLARVTSGRVRDRARYDDARAAGFRAARRRQAAGRGRGGRRTRDAQGDRADAKSTSRASCSKRPTT